MGDTALTDLSSYYLAAKLSHQRRTNSDMGDWFALKPMLISPTLFKLFLVGQEMWLGWGAEKVCCIIIARYGT